MFKRKFGKHRDFVRILNFMEAIMATVTELNAKVDELQANLDAEQEQVRAAISALEVVVADLRDQLAKGATPAELDALATRIEDINTDLMGTIPDAES